MNMNDFEKGYVFLGSDREDCRYYNNRFNIAGKIFLGIVFSIFGFIIALVLFCLIFNWLYQ